jgi:LacI family transcriptional regulator
MRDVATLSGHSLSTVDRVLSGRIAVRSDTAERVLRAADELGFRAAGVIRERVAHASARRTFGFLMPRTDTHFYDGVATALRSACAGYDSAHVRPIVDFLDGLTPSLIAERMVELGTKVDAMAVVTADHPAISAAIAELKLGGIPVFALVSDLSSSARAGYAGLDNRRVGRTAAWFITHTAKEPGPIAVLIGTHRFQCQELCEMSFRSFVREHAPDFELCETRITLESDAHAEEAMRDLLRRHPDLAGFYVGGGGIGGVLQALRDDGVPLNIVGVGHELTPPTHEALISGRLQAVLSHPLGALAAALVSEMDNAVARPTSGLRQVVVPFDTCTPESV